MDKNRPKLSGWTKDPAIVELLDRGLDHLMAGRLQEAAMDFARALDIDPDNGDAYNLSGLVALERGDAHVARQLIGRAVRLAPACALFQFNLGLAQATQGATVEAIASFGCAQRLDPANVETLLALGQALTRAGRAEEAQAVLARAAGLAGQGDCIAAGKGLAKRRA